MTRPLLTAIEEEYRRYRALAEAAMRQLDDGDLARKPIPEGNSVAILVWHLSGNFKSRFTDFLTTDGEKPWRKRDEEFEDRAVTKAQLLEKWDEGWGVLLTTLAALSDEELGSTVTIRGQGLTVREALLRSLAHASYHVGQVVLVARALRGNAWTFLSIAPGGSAAYNTAPVLDRPADFRRAVETREDDRPGR
ncbi:MAG: DUF1572 family protein [Candidatus Eisenbacteria bacterium]|nr:DUF1572 family protein [Candidatus Eisenbacteria bacterium]